MKSSSNESEREAFKIGLKIYCIICIPIIRLWGWSRLRLQPILGVFSNTRICTVLRINSSGVKLQVTD